MVVGKVVDVNILSSIKLTCYYEAILQERGGKISGKIIMIIIKISIEIMLTSVNNKIIILGDDI